MSQLLSLGLAALVGLKGTLRNQDGADILAKMMTLISTWRLNGQNPFYSFRAII